MAMNSVFSKIVALVIALFMVVSLAACGDPATNDDGTGTTNNGTGTTDTTDTSVETNNNNNQGGIEDIGSILDSLKEQYPALAPVIDAFIGGSISLSVKESEALGVPALDASAHFSDGKFALNLPGFEKPIGTDFTKFEEKFPESALAAVLGLNNFDFDSSASAEDLGKELEALATLFEKYITLVTTTLVSEGYLTTVEGDDGKVTMTFTVNADAVEDVLVAFHTTAKNDAELKELVATAGTVLGLDVSEFDAFLADDEMLNSILETVKSENGLSDNRSFVLTVITSETGVSLDLSGKEGDTVMVNLSITAEATETGFVFRLASKDPVEEAELTMTLVNAENKTELTMDSTIKSDSGNGYITIDESTVKHTFEQISDTEFKLTAINEAHYEDKDPQGYAYESDLEATVVLTAKMTETGVELAIDYDSTDSYVKTFEGGEEKMGETNASEAELKFTFGATENGFAFTFDVSDKYELTELGENEPYADHENTVNGVIAFAVNEDGTFTFSIDTANVSDGEETTASMAITCSLVATEDEIAFAVEEIKSGDASLDVDFSLTIKAEDTMPEFDDILDMDEDTVANFIEGFMGGARPAPEPDFTPNDKVTEEIVETTEGLEEDLA